ncbi:hypothetical protein Rhe02_73650 [Rhizocola hellebori]|uniref:DUF8185 domain-containing protein n=1 Tax=Rhizocola hellebori TaxID=1392758 RepID=A0A8J3VKQ4_9ACTN|nr:hypothetical protein [Rhizocola hellebori]GIH09298.1 hypothetical protein Rhe02_73650 [Rhizocola hellebori]
MAQDVDLAQFARRLLRFDAGALIRLRGDRAWGLLPWSVLVSVSLPTPVQGDRVFAAKDGTPRDAQWVVALPPAAASTVEVVPLSSVLGAAQAAAKTLRELAGRAGERAIRDALLDHEVITGVSDVDGTSFTVTQRLVQAMVRMGFAQADPIEIRVTGPWTALASPLGQAWHRQQSQLTVRPIVNHLHGR